MPLLHLTYIQHPSLAIQYTVECWLLFLMVLGLPGSCCCPASQESTVLHIVGSEKGQNSKFEVQSLLSVYPLCHHKFEKL